MTKFFLSKILLSLIILISLSTPLLASAGIGPMLTGSYTANASSAPAQPQASSCLDDLNWYQSIIGGLGNLFLWVPQKISDIVLAISSYSISEVLKYPITNDQGDNAAAAKAFKSAWKATRNLGNMLIVLGFSIVGIATALRIREYEAKKALFPLIIVAILINFSGVICGVIIDAANLTMNGLSSGGALGEFGKSFTADLKGAITKTGCESLKANDFGTFILNNISFGIVYIVVALAFLFLSFVIIVRMAMLGILYILSPLALACYAFPMPNAKKLFNEWWDQFLNWAMQGVSLTFFIYIAASVSKELLGGTKIDGSDGTTAKLIVVLMVLITGLIFAIKSNPAVAGLAKAAASFAGGAMVGAVAGSGKIADKMLGGRASNAVQKIQGGYGRSLEAVGLRKVGSTQNMQSKALEESSSSMAKAYESAKSTGDTGTVARIEKLATKGTGVKAAAAMRALTETGNLDSAFKDKNGKLDTAAVAQRISYAESNGASGIKSKALEKNYQLAAALHPDRVTNVMNANPGFTPEQATRTVNREQLATNLPSMSASAIGKIDHTDLQGSEGFEFVRDNFTPATVNKVRTSGNQQLKNTLKGHSFDFIGAEVAAKKSGDNAEATKMRRMDDAINRL